jgi:hypothetical protein
VGRLSCIVFILALVPGSFCQKVTDAEAGNPAAFTIAIDQPVYANEPIWVHVLNGQIGNVRYPFYPAVGFFGCNKLEVRHNGTLLSPRTIPLTSYVGLVCGSSAPAGSPEGRLPLHVLFPLTQPGRYSVLWSTFSFPEKAKGEILGLDRASQWLTFTVLPETSEQHEKWFKSLLAHPPKDSGQVAGDYLPALVAGAPDRRALSRFLDYTYVDDQVVAGEAASALILFPESDVMRAVVSVIKKLGPSDQLAYYASYHRGWTLADEVDVVHAAAKYLNPPELKVAPAPRPDVITHLQPDIPTPTSAAVKLLYFIFYVPNHAWPADGDLKDWANAQVLRAAPSIMAHGNVTAVIELAQYLGSMQPSAEAHALLLQIANRDDEAAVQGKICLGWHRPD